jgi:hypothetical protein
VAADAPRLLGEVTPTRSPVMGHETGLTSADRAGGGFRGLEFRVQLDLGFRSWLLGFRVCGLGSSSFSKMKYQKEIKVGKNLPSA